MPSITYLMLRSAQRARLEARTALLQLIFVWLDKFSDSLASGGAGVGSAALPLDARFRGHDEDS
jgi:hypothetical protein